MKDLLKLVCYVCLFAVFCRYVSSCDKKPAETVVAASDSLSAADSLCINSQPKSIVYNLPCRVTDINPQKEGKALLVFFLHGGCKEHKLDNILDTKGNHLMWESANDSIKNYLGKKGIKAVVVEPVCSKADSWAGHAADIKQIADDYVASGIADASRIYITGTSDGGVGVFDIVNRYPDVFAAGISVGCSKRDAAVPVAHSAEHSGKNFAYMHRTEALDSLFANVRK